MPDLADEELLASPESQDSDQPPQQRHPPQGHGAHDKDTGEGEGGAYGQQDGDGKVDRQSYPEHDLGQREAESQIEPEGQDHVVSEDRSASGRRVDQVRAPDVGVDVEPEKIGKVENGEPGCDKRDGAEEPDDLLPGESAENPAPQQEAERQVEQGARPEHEPGLDGRYQMTW